MIISFKHRGLKRFCEKGDRSRISPQLANTLNEVLSLLEVAQMADDMNVPGYRLHPLKGDRKGYWAVHVSKNWRITFRFEAGNVCDVNLEDYH